MVSRSKYLNRLSHRRWYPENLRLLPQQGPIKKDVKAMKLQARSWGHDDAGKKKWVLNKPSYKRNGGELQCLVTNSFPTWNRWCIRPFLRDLVCRLDCWQSRFGVGIEMGKRKYSMSNFLVRTRGGDAGRSPITGILHTLAWSREARSKKVQT